MNYWLTIGTAAFIRSALFVFRCSMVSEPYTYQPPSASGCRTAGPIPAECSTQIHYKINHPLGGAFDGRHARWNLRPGPCTTDTAGALPSTPEQEHRPDRQLLQAALVDFTARILKSLALFRLLEWGLLAAASAVVARAAVAVAAAAPTAPLLLLLQPRNAVGYGFLLL